MLSDAKLPKSLWAEVMRTAVDLINIFHSTPLDGNVPREFGPGNMFLVNTWECLVVKHMFTFLRIKDRSLMIKPRNAFYSDVGMKNFGTDYGIHRQ